jgi:hypothetical protein
MIAEHLLKLGYGSFEMSRSVLYDRMQGLETGLNLATLLEKAGTEEGTKCITARPRVLGD